MTPRQTAALATLGTVLLLGGCTSGGGQPSATPEHSPTSSRSVSPGATSPTSSPSASPTELLQVNPEFEVPEITQDGIRGKVLKAFWDYYRVSVAAQDKMDPTHPRYPSVMTGQALTAHSKFIRDLKAKGYKLYGAPVITDVQILDMRLALEPPQAVVGACVDDINWVGREKPRPPLPGHDTAFTRVGVSLERGVWKVYATAHEKRDQGRCAQ